MTPRRARPSLAERTSGKYPGGAWGAQPRRSAVGDGGRHCWVVDPPGAPGRWPGLLTQWRREQSGWQGLVAYVVPTERGALLMQEWIDASRLQAGGPASS